MKRVALSGFVAVGAIMAILGGSHWAAATPSHWTSYVFPYGPEVSEDFCDVPGLSVEEQGVDYGRERWVAHGPDGLPHYYVKGHFEATLTNVANVRFVRMVGTYHGGDVRVTSNGDGTVTKLVKHQGQTLTYSQDDDLLARSSGQVEFELLYDDAGTPTDPTDDEFIEFVGFLKETGRADDFCDAAVPALS
jgi:hypothetical protein